jgi:hypothetical protein
MARDVEAIRIVEAEQTAVSVTAAGASEVDFEVQLPSFSGPLAVLLHLIESRQLDVLTVPLADVADA